MDEAKNEFFAALRMMPRARETVEQAEKVLIEAVMDSGWTWEQMGAAYGERSKQAMQQHYKRRGGERSWSAARKADGPDVEAVQEAVIGLLLNFRATDHALSRTMHNASWNNRDTKSDPYLRRMSWDNTLYDAMDDIEELFGRKFPDADRGDESKVEEYQAIADQHIERLRRHRASVDTVIARLEGLRGDLGSRRENQGELSR